MHRQELPKDGALFRRYISPCDRSSAAIGTLLRNEYQVKSSLNVAPLLKSS